MNYMVQSTVVVSNNLPPLIRRNVIYIGTSVHGHLTATSKVTSPIKSSLLSPKLYSTVQRIGR